MVQKYHNDFLKEVEANVEEGNWVKMCMQCGVCSGSCPLGAAWEHPPQEIFMMIRAGKREEVLRSDSMWMCTSCYNCYVRCPRTVPVTHVMHGIAEYAYRLGRSPKNQPTQHLSSTFWNNCTQNGRVNEVKLTQSLYFKDGLVSGLKKALEMKDVGLGMVKAKRLNPLEALGMAHKCKDVDGIHAMLAKAEELEAGHRAEKAGKS
jgi:quinone-modifying oxidoreductase subunit QmoC